MSKNKEAFLSIRENHLHICLFPSREFAYKFILHILFLFTESEAEEKKTKFVNELFGFVPDFP